MGCGKKCYAHNTPATSSSSSPCNGTLVSKKCNAGEKPSPFFGARPESPDFRYVHLKEPMSAGFMVSLEVQDNS